jgi:hypothetical protein
MIPNGVYQGKRQGTHWKVTVGKPKKEAVLAATYHRRYKIAFFNSSKLRELNTTDIQLKFQKELRELKLCLSKYNS